MGEPRTKTHLNCPCGYLVVGLDEDDLVNRARHHLATAHATRTYSRDEILLMAW